ncbi:MFS transporter [Paramuribaculum intestinale]|uniref:MFS transporter n=7 Tax=Paramuribaculum intestinale TaxID=2094151 RepID=A0A2V1IXN3_9BACT|nr:MFS transporter [Paramuribaculum intestinale]MBJ2186987.1 MFS transporter [Muribaculaceae bacterium]MCX4329300.1 MFS transporter [Paramuribaculum intestinale]PWB08187.1 MFS transporter [Paramuribaculum intestinale]ROS93155.1 MFS transporter [Muribaculaceae bacterium Isolate-043 (Harlan)]
MALQNKKFYPWLVVGLLWVVALLNYMDRQMLSTMQQNIANDIHALQNAEAFGALMAIFLWVYGISSPFSGAVADRVSRKWLIVGSLGVWSAVTYAMGLCHDFQSLMWLRGIMGISEALYIPSALSLIADYFTGRGRSLAIGLHMTGLYCGQALGGFGSMVASTWSWQQTFHWFGIIGVAYAIVLIFLLHEKSGRGVAARPVPSGEAQGRKGGKESMLQSFGVVFSTMAFWVILFFFASSSIPGWATKNWLPTLFHDNLDLSMDWAGPMATLTIAVSSFIGVMIGGPISDRWVRSNVRGRIYTSAIGMAMMIPALVFIGLAHNAWLSVLAGLFFGIGYGMFDANNMPILCQFVSSRQRAMAYGLMNSVGVIMGAITTQLLGSLAESVGLGLCFALMGGILLIALALQLTVLRPKYDDKDQEEAMGADNEAAETVTA